MSISQSCESVIYCLYIQNNQQDIEMSTDKEETPAPPKIMINKMQLLADVIAFFSIIGAYFFISITLHVDVFESLFDFKLDNYSLIAFLFLLYTVFILILKGLSLVLSIKMKPQGENQITKTIDSQINSSLFNVLVISAVYIVVHSYVNDIALEQFCHVAVWLWVGETARIFGTFLGSATKIDSLSYWGTSIEIMLLVGGILEAVDCGIFGLF